MRNRVSTLVLVALGCGGSTPAEPVTHADRMGVWVPAPSQTILHSPQSSLLSPKQVLVKDRSTWQALWDETWAGVDTAPPLPQLDFVTSSVVVVGVGRRAGPGYSVTIDSIVSFTSGAVAFATDSQPGAGCNPLSGTSSPVHMAHMPGHPPILEWRVSMSLRNCP